MCADSPHLVFGTGDGSERGAQARADRNIITANHGDVLRDLQPVVESRLDDTDRDHIVGSKDCGWEVSLTEHFICHVIPALDVVATAVINKVL